MWDQDISLRVSILTQKPTYLSHEFVQLLLAAKFYPENPGKASRSELDKDGRPSSAFQAVHKFLRSQGDVQSTWHRLAKEGLAIEHSYELTSSPAIVSACLLIVLGRDQQSYLKMLLDLAIRSAQAMNFHMLGEGMAPLEEEGDVRGNGNWEERRRRHLEAVIRREESCRIWWFLASRDWTFGQRDSTYRIHPSQFNTSHPLNLEDEDLSMGINSAEKEEKWTEMTYPIAQIKLSEIIRLSIDLKNEAHSHFFGSNTWSAASCQVLHSALNNFLRDLPSFYRVDAPLGTGEYIKLKINRSASLLPSDSMFLVLSSVFCLLQSPQSRTFNDICSIYKPSIFFSRFTDTISEILRLESRACL